MLGTLSEKTLDKDAKLCACYIECNVVFNVCCTGFYTFGHCSHAVLILSTGVRLRVNSAHRIYVYSLCYCVLRQVLEVTSQNSQNV